MLFLYNIIVKIYRFLIWLAAFKNPKARALLNGRKNLLQNIEEQIQDKSPKVWFHFASLGEFEQGRTVIERLKEIHPEKKILITFFSPSGYEIRKNYAFADYVFYLPEDNLHNAQKFIEIIKPEIAIFTKYEYWYYFFNELKKRSIPLYIISGIFRKKQPFFQWFGTLHREMLACVTHFFVQNHQSLNLLHSINYNNVTISGDTRFDRVFENAQNTRNFSEIEDFKKDRLTLIAGSTWPEDEAHLAKLLETQPDLAIILAPHEIAENKLLQTENLFKNKSQRFSEFSLSSQEKSVLIIDNIGMLSSLYKYGDFAYIGGGFGAGIHNTLEAAAFGIPVIFGPKYQKFDEAKDLINLGAAFSILNAEELIQIAEKLGNDTYRKNCGNNAKKYVQQKTGATQIILKHIFSR